MGPTAVQWRSLVLATGADAPYRLLSLEGWEELPPARYEKQARLNAHGAHRSAVYSDERLVVVEGFSWSAAERDELLRELRAATVFGEGDDTEPLTVTAAGRTLTAGAQLLQARPMLTRGEWGVGRFGWLLQWRCPDPLRYGPPDTDSTGLPTVGGGLTYPLTYPLQYGAVGATGRITLTNPGTAEAPMVLTVRGPLPQGFEVSDDRGRRLTYAAPVPDGQTVELDTAAGTVMVEGTASRRGNLSHADWLTVPAADPFTDEPGVVTLQFTSLGGDNDAAVELSATWSETTW